MANTKITSRVLADNAVLTANITDANVTTAKVADNAVTGDKVADDVALAGNPTTTTQSAGNNTTRIATTAFVSTAVANLADSAPDALNTLNELAAAMGDDANFSTTVTNSIAAKLPLAGGTMTGALDLDGQELKLDADADTSITADTDDVVDFKVGGTDRLRLAGNNLFLNGATDARIQLGSGGAGANTVGNNTVHIRGDGVDAKYMAASGGDHIFESNGGHLVTMKDSGKVGIGNASPSHLLHVNAADGASDNTQAMTIENNEATDGRSYGLKIKAGSTVNDAPLFIQDHDAANDLMIVRGNGAVGIGTTSPQQKLQVEDGNIYIRGNTAGEGLLINDSTSSSGTYSITREGSGATGYLKFGTPTDETHSFIFDGGNVGIGTASPTTLLHVGDSTDNNTWIQTASSAGWYSGIKLTRGAGDWSSTGNNNFGVYVTDDGLNIGKFTAAGSNITGRADYMTVADGGKVGIGITAPNSNLEVFDASGGAGTGVRINCNNGGSDVWDLYSTTAGRLYVKNPNYSGGVYIQHSATSWTSNSDENLKENITSLGTVGDKLKNYRTSYFNWKDDNRETPKRQIGFIAQDWETDFPEVVNKMEGEPLGMQYTETIPILLKYIQELEARIETLES